MSIKLAYSTLACPDWSLAQVIEATKRDGFDGIELRLLDGEIVPPDLSAGERERVATQTKAAGVPICCLDTSLRIASSVADAETRAAAERDAAAYLEMAAQFEAPLIRVFGGNPPEGQTVEDATPAMADLLGRMGQRAGQLGVGIALETHDAFSAAKDAMRVIGQVESKHVGVLWDTHHPYRMGESVAEAYNLVVSRLMHVHVKDAVEDASERTGWKLVLLGEGEVPVAEAVRYLKGVGYDKWIAVEWEKKWHPEIEPPEVALPHDGALLRKWLSE